MLCYCGLGACKSSDRKILNLNFRNCSRTRNNSYKYTTTEQRESLMYQLLVICISWYYVYQ